MFYLVMRSLVMRARKKLQLRKVLKVVQVGSLLSQNLHCQGTCRVHRDSIVVVKCSTMKRSTPYFFCDNSINYGDWTKDNFVCRA